MKAIYIAFPGAWPRLPQWADCKGRVCFLVVFGAAQAPQPRSVSGISLWLSCSIKRLFQRLFIHMRPHTNTHTVWNGDKTQQSPANDSQGHAATNQTWLSGSYRRGLLMKHHWDLPSLSSPPSITRTGCLCPTSSCTQQALAHLSTVSVCAQTSTCLFSLQQRLR